MTHAYQEIYLSNAQAALGDAFDYAVRVCGVSGENFIKLFTVSSVSKHMENGEPAYLAGKSGIELAAQILAETTGMTLIECTAFLGAAAHAGNTVKHNGIPGLYTVQQLVQLLPSAAGRSCIDLTDDMSRWVGGGNVAHLAFDILLWCGNAAVAVHGHTVSLLTFL